MRVIDLPATVIVGASSINTVNVAVVVREREARGDPVSITSVEPKDAYVTCRANNISR